MITQVDAGITADFAPIGSPTGLSDSYKQVASRVRTVAGDYMRGGYWLVGPSDSTDGWKNWVATPVANRVAFQMRTKDRRIIGAASVTAPGTYFTYDANIAFFNPTRGTYLQTFYYYHRYGAGTTYNNGPLAAIGRTEMDLLKAEALVRLNRATEALPLINKTRIANGKLPRDRHQRTTGRGRMRSDERRPARAALVGCAALREANRGRRRRRTGVVLGRARLEHARRQLVHHVSDSRPRARDSASSGLHVRRWRSRQRTDANVGQVPRVGDTREVLVGRTTRDSWSVGSDQTARCANLRGWCPSSGR